MGSLRLTIAASLTALLAVVVGSSCNGKATSSDHSTAPDAAGTGNQVAEGGTGSAPLLAAGSASLLEAGSAPLLEAGAGGGASEAPLCPNSTSCGDCGACVADPSESLFTAGFSCVHGTCVASCYEGTGDCNGKLGCETALNTADDCGLCGRKACAAANTLLTCSAGDQACTSPVCAPGFANCQSNHPDCETAFGAASSCFPGYVGTIKHRTRSLFPVVAMGPDGSLFLGGDLDDTDDFDPTSGVDQRAPGPLGMAYITKLNPDGSYAWTRTFDASFLLFYELAADANGVVAIGVYEGSVDFDPGAGIAVQTASGNGVSGDSFVLKLTQAGEYSWAQGLFASDPNGRVTATSVVLSAGDVYFGGGYSSTADFDPGPGQSLLSASGYERAFVAKLDAGGHFVWVRGLHGDACSGWVFAMTATPEGRIWVAGSRDGPCTFGSTAPLPGGHGYVAAFTPEADLFGEWPLAAAADDVRSLAATADGSIFVGGVFRQEKGGEVDINPGPGVDLHSLVPGNTGFVTKLASDGSYLWSQLMGSTGVTVAATPDGGLLASGLLPDLRFVSKVQADGAAAWSLGFFATGDDFRFAAGKTSFVVAGVVDNGSSVDFNPAPAVSERGFDGQTTFFSRYAY